MNKEKQSNEILRIIAALGHAIDGLKAVRSHPAFCIELLASCIMMPLSFILGKTSIEHAMLFASVMLVLIVELLNTGIENAIDRISLEWHALSKIAKDVGSAAVLLSLINAGVVWALILWF